MLYTSNLPLNETTFKFATEYNQSLLSQRLSDALITAQEYYWIDKTGEQIIAPGNHKLNICRKTDDLVAAIIVGALPISTGHGVDAYIWNPITLEMDPIEVKLCYKSKANFIKTSNGALNAGTAPTFDRFGKLNNASLRSSVSAHYEIVNNLNSKAIDTYLVLIDEDLLDLICVYKIPGSKIVDILSTNAATGEIRTSKKRCIHLSKFVNEGMVVDSPAFTSFGLIRWEEYLRTNLNNFIGHYATTSYFGV